MSNRDAVGVDVLPAVFAKLGYTTATDLLLHFPLRYEDETRLTPIRDVRQGWVQQVQGVVVRCQLGGRARQQLVVTVEDAGVSLDLRFLHVYPGQAQRMANGALIRAVGEVRTGLMGSEIVHPRWRVVKADTPLPDCLTPVYSVVAGVTQAMVRKHIHTLLDRMDWVDTVPEAVRAKLGLIGFGDSVLALHKPAPDVALAALSERYAPAWRRIKFDELLAQQLALQHMRGQRSQSGAPMLMGHGKLSQRLLAELPFTLTAAQHRVWQDICTDLAQPAPMQRLLQGDVGSGKTVVAALAAATAIESGYQAAFMAPTELLAEQHYRKLCEWFAPLSIPVVWLSGSVSKKQRQAAIAQLHSGEVMLAAGTHALFQSEVNFARLGLAVIDEQHRFGVAQRLALRNKGAATHQLMMSATPIPRTLAMSYHADLDVSVIDELPPGRTPVTTRLVDASRREHVVAWLHQRCGQGRQAYWVCPLIEESEALQLQTAVDTHAMLVAAMPTVQIGLLHGRMRSAEKATVMAAFSAGQIGLLVATTVIEVGVDVPNASLMVIEHAERMGLAQLHQLRGRVGRGTALSSCILLFQEPLSDVARARLKVVFESTDGFYIAREDLRIRGPGEWLGARQSGAPILRFADPLIDEDLLGDAREAARRMLRDYPQEAIAHVTRWFGVKQEYGQS